MDNIVDSKISIKLKLKLLPMISSNHKDIKKYYSFPLKEGWLRVAWFSSTEKNIFEPHKSQIQKYVLRLDEEVDHFW